jgi:hypothetical protein
VIAASPPQAPLAHFPKLEHPASALDSEKKKTVE